MNLVLTVLEIVAPVFILALIGFTWVKLGYDYSIEFVTRLAMTLGVPCLIFTALMRAEIEPAALAALSLATLAAYGLVTVLIALLVWTFQLAPRTFLAPLIFGNTGNLGLPLALFAFGQEGLSLAVVVFAVMAILSFTLGIWLVAGGGNPLTMLKEPLVWATLAGGVFLWQGWRTPAFLTNTLELVGQLAIPLMLITLGVAIARLSSPRTGLAIVLSLLKLTICATAAAVVGRWFALPPTALAVLVLQVATPVAVTSYLLAVKYGADAGEVASLVVVSTLVSVVALPLLLGLLI